MERTVEKWIRTLFSGTLRLGAFVAKFRPLFKQLHSSITRDRSIRWLKEQVKNYNIPDPLLGTRGAIGGVVFIFLHSNLKDEAHGRRSRRKRE